MARCYKRYEQNKKDADPHYFVKKIYRERRRISKLKGIPFLLDVNEILNVPDVCPILGIPLKAGGHNNPNSPSLDRIKPELGYVVGNVQWISFRANKLKSDATYDEMKKLMDWYGTIYPP